MPAASGAYVDHHAQAVALASRLLGVPATIVMPTDAPHIKRQATEGYGATVVEYDRYTEDREAIGAALAERDGLALVPPYDHPHIIAGQGTAALELLEDVGPLDAILTPLGGGGLLSGTILAARALGSSARVYGVEPEAGDDGRQSLRAGRIITIPTPQTIADGAQTLHLGELTFPIIADGVTDLWTATDAELVDAMRLVASAMKLVVEPTGVLALAALRHHAAEFAGARVGVLLSGGNVDPARFGALMADHVG